MALELLREQATRFRAAIERCAREALPTTFDNFPRGSCGDVTPLLGTFLADQGLGAFTYMLGERVGGVRYQSHAWLEVEGAIVDITADQFGELMEPVMVVP